MLAGSRELGWDTLKTLRARGTEHPVPVPACLFVAQLWPSTDVQCRVLFICCKGYPPAGPQRPQQDLHTTGQSAGWAQSRGNCSISSSGPSDSACADSAGPQASAEGAQAQRGGFSLMMLSAVPPCSVLSSWHATTLANTCCRVLRPAAALLAGSHSQSKMLCRAGTGATEAAMTNTMQSLQQDR